MGKSSPSPPPAPDYQAAAQAQGAANAETARIQGQQANPNYYGPLGSREVVWQGDQAHITDRLTPQSQARFDQENRIISNVGNVAESGVNRVGGAMQQPFSTAGMPLSSGGVEPAGYAGIFAPTKPGEFSMQDPGDFQSWYQTNQGQFAPQTSGDATYTGAIPPPSIQPDFPTSIEGVSLPSRDAFTTPGKEAVYQTNYHSPWTTPTRTIASPAVAEKFDEAGYNAALADYKNQLAQSQNQYITDYYAGQNQTPPTDTAGQPDMQAALNAWESAQRDYQSGLSQYNQQLSGYDQQLAEFEARKQSLMAPNLTALPGAAPTLGTNFSPQQNVMFGMGSAGPINRSFGPTAPIQGGVQGQQYQTGIGDAGNLERALANTPGPQFGITNAGGPQRGVDFSGAPQLPGVNDFSTDRQRVEDALMGRINEEFDIDREKSRTQLLARGFNPSSEGFTEEMKRLDRAQNDARFNAILAGGQEQSRLFGLGSQARGQYTGEQLAQGQFGNQAQAQQFGQDATRQQAFNQASDQAFGQELGQRTFSNQAQQQAYNQLLGQGQFANQAREAQFGQGLAQGQFANAAQQQQYGQMAGQFGMENQAQQQQFGQNQAQQQAYNAAQQQAFAQAASGQQMSNEALQAQYGLSQQQAAAINALAQQNYQNNLLSAQAGSAIDTTGMNMRQAQAAFQNQARQQQMQEQAWMRQLPLNELNALRTGSQVTLPQFQQFNAPQSIAPAPMFAATQAQGQYDQGAYNAQAAAAANKQQGLYNMAALGLTAATGGMAAPLMFGMGGGSYPVNTGGWY